MAKKSFKDTEHAADKFFGKLNTQTTQEIRPVSNVQDIHNTQTTSNTSNTQEKPYRINLALRPEFKRYLFVKSHKSLKSITEYINDLIQIDMDANPDWDN